MEFILSLVLAVDKLVQGHNLQDQQRKQLYHRLVQLGRLVNCL